MWVKLAFSMLKVDRLANEMIRFAGLFVYIVHLSVKQSCLCDCPTLCS